MCLALILGIASYKCLPLVAVWFRWASLFMPLQIEMSSIGGTVKYGRVILNGARGLGRDFAGLEVLWRRFRQFGW